MEHWSPKHDFFLIKEKQDIQIDDFDYIKVIDRIETEKYVTLDHCFFPDDLLMDMAYPSFSGLSAIINNHGHTLINQKSDAEKIANLCKGWLIIISEMAELTKIPVERRPFRRKDLLYQMEKLNSMAKQMIEHDDYVIYYCGI